jgi:hypothetical protein
MVDLGENNYKGNVKVRSVNERKGDGKEIANGKLNDSIKK